jgi:CheY-like chemotaxis protein
MDIRMNFAGVTALVAESDTHSVNLLGEILRGFGLDQQIVVKSGADAQAHLAHATVELCFFEASLRDMEGAELVRWVRRHAPDAVRFVPIIILTSYSQIDAVIAARDGGANFVVRKPISPKVLYDRLAWAAQGTRKFIESETYAGPDRRFRQLGPPDGIGRRSTDLSKEVGEQFEPNMTQEEIDALMRPTKMVSA